MFLDDLQNGRFYFSFTKCLIGVINSPSIC